MAEKPIVLTADDAWKRVIDTAATLTVDDYGQVVLIATADHMAWYADAKYERVGPWHLIWTVRHGCHVEHDDDLCKIHVYQQPRVGRVKHRTGRRGPAVEVR